MFRTRFVSTLACLVMAGTAMAASGAGSGPFSHLKVRNLGPAVSGGRVATVTGIPGKPGIYYVGAAGGGLWKTTDDGMHWKALMTKQAASIGAVALAPSNPNDVWVGTGESNPRNDVLDGHGIYFSPDGGKTWQFKGLAHAGQIARIVVNPTNPNIVYVAVQGSEWVPNKTRGVFMTTDGGKTWKKVLYVNDMTGASDIAMDPQNPNILFAGMWTVQRKPWTLINGGKDGGIWRSEDGGRTWHKLTDGLPKGPTNRVALAIAPSDPNQVYALMATKHEVLWKSDDMGDHWHAVTDNHAIDIRPFYFSTIAVAPNNPERVYFGSFHLLVSNNGGKTAHVLDRGVHVDHHDIWIDPKNPNRIIQGNDGGVYESLNGGKSWRYFNNLPIEEFYAVAIGHTKPFEVCGGLQDNNAACGPSNSLDPSGITGADWWNPAGGDGVQAVPAPSDPSIVYSDSQDGFAFRINTKNMTAKFIKPYLPGANDVPSSKLKYRFNWSAPITVSPSHPDTVYVGANVVFKSTDGGKNFKPISPDLTRNNKKHQPVAGGPVNHDISGAENFDTILSIAIAPTNHKVIWVGTDDGLVWVTRDGGKHWHKVGPDLPAAARLGRIYKIGVSPFSAGTAYVAVDAHMLGDKHPYVYRTSNYGRDWQRITRGLPQNVPAVVVREDPNQKGFLALGTERGLYISHDNGNHWMHVTANLPVMAIWDLKFTRNPHDLVLATHGRGFWIFDNIQPLEEWDGRIAHEPFHLFHASTGTEWVSYYGRHIDPGPSAFVAPNPPSGPVISYYLSSAAKGGKASITVTDAQGHTVATFHGPAKAGVNRIAWNMHYDGADVPMFMKGAFQRGNHGPSGPLALPGTYHVKVTVGAHSGEQSVEVVSDPRLHLSMTTQTKALSAGLRLRNEVDALGTMAKRTHDMLATLGQVIGSTSAAAKGSARAGVHQAAVTLKKELGALMGKIYNPKVQRTVPEDDLHYVSRFGERFYSLYGEVGHEGPNQSPNVEQRQLVHALEGKFDTMLANFNGTLHQDVVQFNKKAYEAGVQTLAVGKPVKVKPVTMPVSAQ